MTATEGVLTGAAMRARRLALGLTQEQFGAVIGKSKATVARWERGELTIESPKLLDMALQLLEQQRD